VFVVPKGARHNPVAEDECLTMLIERKSTLHTGNVVTEKTRSVAGIEVLCAHRRRRWRCATMSQVTLGLEARNPDFHWRPRHPKLCGWFDRIAARPSFAVTAPPHA
jgi:glutathione S-transferase